MNLDEIKQLIASLEASQLRKLAIKRGDFELQLEKEDIAAPLHPVAHLPPHYHPPRALPHAEPAAVATQIVEPPKTEPAKQGKFVTSPMVGTFYATPSPDQPAFVKVGDVVQEHTVVCIIEAMKVMNEVRAGVSGVVAEILVDHAQPVEFGTKILRIV